MVQLSNDRSTGQRVRRRAESRRLEILRAAARTFREKGFAGAGMRDIAAAADLSPGNLYHYFKGKDEILYFCQDRWLDHMLEAVGSVRAGDRPASAPLRDVLVTHVRYLLDELEGSAAHLEVEGLPPELRRPIIAKRDRYERDLCRLVSAGVKSGEFVPCDPKLVTRAILGALNWTARWFRPEGPKPAPTVAAVLADYLVRGLMAKPSTRLSSPRSSATGGTK